MNCFIFNEGIAFKIVAKRYNVDLRCLYDVIMKYVLYRHDEKFSIELQGLVGINEPFFKNELKPTMQLLCRYYDSMPCTLELKNGLFILCKR